MKTNLFMVICLLTSFFLYAQNFEISGKLKLKKDKYFFTTVDADYLITEYHDINLEPFINEEVIIHIDTVGVKIK